jgi:hypothetical protein
MHNEAEIDTNIGDLKDNSEHSAVEISSFAKCNSPTIHSGMKKVNGELIEVFSLRLQYFPRPSAKHA